MSTTDKDLLSLSSEKRIDAVHEAVATQQAAEKEGKKVEMGYTADQIKKAIVADLPSEMRKLDALRKGDAQQVAVDISLGQYAQERWGFAPGDGGTADGFYRALGLNATQTSITSLTNLGDFDEGYRFLIPEVFREAVRLGLRRPSYYQDLIRAEETVSQMQVTMPSINMSDAMLKKMGELQTFQKGTVSFGSKISRIEKMGIGISMSDETVRFSAINLLSIFLEDVGMKLNMGLDNMAIKTLIEGDQVGGSDSCSVIGVTTTNTMAYRDFLRVWIRMQRLGLSPDAMIMGEDSAMNTFEMTEFKNPYPQYANGTNPSNIAAPALNIRTPLPNNQNVIVHGGLPSANYIMFVNKLNAMIKLNAAPLRVEAEREAARQADSYYVSLITGFATLKRDARLIVDKSVNISAANFPAYFGVDAVEQEEITE